ncbi:hypothetical protein GCK72_026066 [Caenorhabditis remanei]|uniref:Uncharacterized protein n=1 Tax=Caenorhabditis remanei TaxID=31234 RepID=A0A6A5G3N1_CAERE|nr:hypothetical protein GCK72_026066 [Caenorhabditis remanei]KAF1749598.1 hypothetical protein GCK72_026066 [Caenorhabditis remanei]
MSCCHATILKTREYCLRLTPPVQRADSIITNIPTSSKALSDFGRLFHWRSETVVGVVAPVTMKQLTANPAIITARRINTQKRLKYVNKTDGLQCFEIDVGKGPSKQDRYVVKGIRTRYIRMMPVRARKLPIQFNLLYHEEKADGCRMEQIKKVIEWLFPTSDMLMNYKQEELMTP